ncbi:hypothetical protein BSP99_00005 (plasmid) [Corynebacterium glutamicum]|nr:MULTISPECIES: hypothetical protein [Terrabacteria group]ALP51646.1 hypothetical protein AC079_15585 [Corynebacterium glutamicum]ANU35172.1 hypothetical protein BBD29_15375 [Corynebacterium glutamicum]APT06033.1 hypothetical protein BSP99_00005 [Corynebacterium glutamicum]PNK25602.1 hypothetical protein CBR55_32070 [Bacillus thuringiensis]
MTQKNILPEHDPVPNYEHARLIAGEAPNFLILSYLPNQEYGYQRLIHFNHAGDSTGYIDLPSEPNQPGRNPHYTNLDQLAEIPEPHYLSHQLSTHNDHIRRIVKNDLSQHEVDQLIKAEKQKLAEANKPKVLSLDEEREARALKKAATNLAEAAVRNLEPRVHNRKWHATMTNAAKRRVDELTALQFNANAIAQEQEKYEYHKQFADELPALQAELQQLKEASRQAYTKPAREYLEEAHQHA